MSDADHLVTPAELEAYLVARERRRQEQRSQIGVPAPARPTYDRERDYFLSRLTCRWFDENGIEVEYPRW